MITYECEIPPYPNDPALRMGLVKHVRAHLSMRASTTRDPQLYADEVVITVYGRDGRRYVRGELDRPEIGGF